MRIGSVRGEAQQRGPRLLGELILDHVLAVILADCRGVSPEISQVIVQYADHVQDVLIANTEGVFVTDRRVHSRIRVAAVADPVRRDIAPRVEGDPYFSGTAWYDSGEEMLKSGIRLTLGRGTTREEIEKTARILPAIVEDLRQLSSR